MGWGKNLSKGVLVSCLFFATSLAASTSGECPRTEDEWGAWRDAQLRELFPRSENQNSITPLRLMLISDDLARCNKHLESVPKAKECLHPFSEFAHWASLGRRKGHTLAVSVTDDDYFAKVPFPDMMELPAELKKPEFLRLLDDNTNPTAMRRALDYIESINAEISDPSLKWTAMIYDSRHLAAPDLTDAYGRFFVLIPGKNFDRFMQFALRTHPDRPLPNGLSTVTIQKTDPATGELLPKPVARLKDFWRMRTAEGYVVSSRLKEMGTLENCYECHKEALLPIHPDPKTFDQAAFGKKLTAVNKLIKSYRNADYFGLNQTAYGPGLGPMQSPLRTDEFLQTCSAGVFNNAAAFEKARSLMQCTSCHNGTQQGVLNFPSGLRRLSIGGTLPLHYVVTYQMMPPGEEISQPEREALLRCLIQELYKGNGSEPGVLEAYLKNGSCWQ